MPCSGIHRSLGTHITQVRSVDLDTWNAGWISTVKAIGNIKSNAMYEATLPKNYDGKPTETDAQELSPKLQKFIRDKYERKRWFLSEVELKKDEIKKEVKDTKNVVVKVSQVDSFNPFSFETPSLPSSVPEVSYNLLDLNSLYTSLPSSSSSSSTNQPSNVPKPTALFQNVDIFANPPPPLLNTSYNPFDFITTTSPPGLSTTSQQVQVVDNKKSTSYDPFVSLMD
jgi:stromal membrane-associated protein